MKSLLLLLWPKSSNNYDQVCERFTGHTILPFIIFTVKQLNPNWMKDELGTRYAASDNGWIDQGLFILVDGSFSANAVASRPLLLLLDSVVPISNPIQSNLQKTTMLCAPTQNIRMSATQFLTFWTTKIALETGVPSIDGTKVCNNHFNGLFKEAWLKAISLKNVIGGFR